MFPKLDQYVRDTIRGKLVQLCCIYELPIVMSQMYQSTFKKLSWLFIHGEFAASGLHCSHLSLANEYCFKILRRSNVYLSSGTKRCCPQQREKESVDQRYIRQGKAGMTTSWSSSGPHNHQTHQAQREDLLVRLRGLSSNHAWATQILNAQAVLGTWDKPPSNGKWPNQQMQTT